ncbi:MAG: hypothetical protein IJA34_01005 [Lachnospiraceae bacterium]|nr:hypothetical protein [Lachnospiraceae bacterium]
MIDKNFISKIDIMKIKAPSGLTYAQELVNAANLLSECIQNRINRGSMQNSISTADIADIKIVGNKMTVTLTIENSIRPSLFNKWNKSNANVFWLLNDGYKVKKDVWFKNIPNFGYRVAEHFVEEGIKDFNSKNSLGIEIEVIRPLHYYG